MDKREKHLKLFDAGQYLLELRTRENRSLAEVGNAIDVSATFLSGVERGVKEPSDDLIRRMADYWTIDEDELFLKYGRSPLVTREVLDSLPELQKTIAQIHRDKRLDDEQKEELYDSITRLYKAAIENVEEG